MHKSARALMTGLTLADGAPAPLPVTQVTQGLDVIATRVFEQRNFDMCFSEWESDQLPLILYYANHPSQDMVWGGKGHR